MFLIGLIKNLSMRFLVLLLVALVFAPLIGQAQTSDGWSNGTSALLTGQAQTNTELIPYDVRIYPVPARSTLHIEFQAPEAGQVQVSCIDLIGRKLESGAIVEVSAAGRLTHELAFTSLVAGSYVLRLVYQPLSGTRPLVLHRRIAVE
jgi:hypothetical protein